MTEKIRVSKETKIFINEVAELYKSGEKFAFFVGAGISIADPAKLPGGNKLKHNLIDYMGECNAHIYNHIKNEDKIYSLINRIPLELLCSIITDMTNDYIIPEFMKQNLSTNIFNNSHISLALLCAVGFCSFIITPNFDTLIEEAFTKVLSNVKLNVSIFHDLMTNKKAGGMEAITLIKVHGCITDNSSIVATLDKVGKGFNDAQAKVLNTIFENYCVIVVGWSDNDYDLTPFFIETPKPIFWIDHLGMCKKLNQISSIVNPDSKRYLEIDSEKFWKVLCSVCNIPEITVVIDPSHQKDLLGDSWGGGEMESLYAAFAWVLFAIGDLENSLFFFQKSKHWIDNKIGPYAAPDILYRYSLVSFLLNRMQLSHDCFHQALKQYESLKNINLYLGLTLCSYLLDMLDKDSSHSDQLEKVVAEKDPEKLKFLNALKMMKSKDHRFREMISRDLLNSGFFLEACIVSDTDLLNRIAERFDYRIITFPELQRAQAYVNYSLWQAEVKNAGI